MKAYTDEQKRAIEKYYPNSDYEELFKWFPGYTKRQIKEIATRMRVKSNNPGHRIDLSDQRFGRLIVEEIDHIDNRGVVFWKCQCDCGTKCIARTNSLRAGKKLSCGCLNRDEARKRKLVDHTGETFGMLTAIERIENYQGRGRTYYRCKCECGNEKIVLGSGLVTGKTKTCGCISKSRKQFTAQFYPDRDTVKMCYLIYKHTAPNGKVYIGITRQDSERRWQNGKGYSTQKRFWRAIQKYGWSSFSHELLAENLTEQEACELEIHYIEQYKSTNPDFGYNVAVGGNTGRTLVTPVIQYYQGKPVNFFESFTQAARTLGVSTSTIRNYINSKTMISGYHFEEMPQIHLYDIDRELYEYEDAKHYVVGQHMNEQRRQRTIERNKRNVRSVNQYDLEGHFIKSYASIAEALRENKGLGGIAAVLRGDNVAKTAGGFQWKYNEGSYEDIEPIQVNGRAVLQLNPDTCELIATYSSMAEAERITGIKSKQIYKACTGIHKTSGGYIWRYKNDVSE